MLKYVKFGVLRPEIPSSSTSKKNAFTLLMSSAKTMKLDKISSNDKLNNINKKFIYLKILCFYLVFYVMLFFVFLSPILFLSPPLIKLSFSSFSVNNCTVHVTTLVIRIKILYRHSAYEWSFWFITRYQQSYIIGDEFRNVTVLIFLLKILYKYNSLICPLVLFLLISPIM
jgi:uncharacterized protein YqhQ